MVSDLRHVSELLVPGSFVLSSPGDYPRVMAAYMLDGYGAFRQPIFECVCFQMLVSVVYGVKQNFCDLSSLQP